MSKKRVPKSKIQAWPDSSFTLKTSWDDWGDSKQFHVHLERRAPGRYGRLEAMHAIVPGKYRLGGDDMFRSARYRKGVLDGARQFFLQAGVPEEEAGRFMDIILKEYPYPTDQELFLDHTNSPFIALVLGERHKDL